MGTLATVTLPPSDAEKLVTAMALVTNTLVEFESKFSLFKPDSEIARLNAAAGKTPLTMSEDTLELLELSRHYGELSGGAFDVTVGPLMRRWGFNGGTIPNNPLTAEELAPVLKKIGYRHIILSENTALLDIKGAEIDLGGIAKGYAVDVCCHRLTGSGIVNALINLGGNIRCLGAPRADASWNIAVRDPFHPERNLGVLRLTSGQAVATSGNYERFVKIGRHRYAHILDPRTGRPVEGMAGVTVVSPSAAEADALSTTLFVQGLPAGLSILKKTASRAALFVPDKHPLEIWVTEDFLKIFTPEAAVANRVFVLK